MRKWLCGLFSVVLALGIAGFSAPRAQAIYNGYGASITQFPFMVSLRLASNPDRHICGGTLISSHLVLTAAHCLEDKTGTSRGPLVAVAGRDMADWPSAPRIAVTDERIPYGYSGSSNWNDVAVVKLATDLTYRPVRLATTEPRVTSTVQALGWGYIDKPLATGTMPSSLQGATFKVDKDTECSLKVMWNPPADYDTSICASGSKVSVNLGDSGGPLLVTDSATGAVTQVGITSLGSDDPKKLEGAFQSVPVQMSWITQASRDLDAVKLRGAGFNATLGEPFSRDLTDLLVSGIAPFTWSLTYSSQPGWAVSSSGLLTGIPTRNDGFIEPVKVTVRVDDAAGSSATLDYYITVQAPPSPKVTMTVGSLQLTYDPTNWKDIFYGPRGPHDSTANDLTNTAPCSNCSTVPNPLAYASLHVMVTADWCPTDTRPCMANYGPEVGPAPAITVGGLAPTWSARFGSYYSPGSNLVWCFDSEHVCVSYGWGTDAAQLEPSQALYDVLSTGVWLS